MEQSKVFFILQNSLDTRCQALVAANIAAVENGEFEVVISITTSFSFRIIRDGFMACSRVCIVSFES